MCACAPLQQQDAEQPRHQTASLRVTFGGKWEQKPFTSPTCSSPLSVSTWGAPSVNQGVLWCQGLIIKVKFCGHVRPEAGGQRVKGEGGLPRHTHSCASPSLPALSLSCSPLPPFSMLPSPTSPSPFPPGFRGPTQGPGIRGCPHFSSCSSLASGSSSDLSSSL